MVKVKTSLQNMLVLSYKRCNSFPFFAKLLPGCMDWHDQDHYTISLCSFSFSSGSLSHYKSNHITGFLQTASDFPVEFPCIRVTLYLHKPCRACCRESSSQRDADTTVLLMICSVTLHLVWWPVSSILVSSDHKNVFLLTSESPTNLWLVKHPANCCCLRSLSNLSLWSLELLQSHDRSLGVHPHSYLSCTLSQFFSIACWKADLQLCCSLSIS